MRSKMSRKKKNEKIVTLDFSNIDDFSNEELWEGIKSGRFVFGEGMVTPILDRLEKVKLRCPICKHKFTIRQSRDYHKRIIYQMIAPDSFTRKMFQPYCPKCGTPLGA